MTVSRFFCTVNIIVVWWYFTQIQNKKCGFVQIWPSWSLITQRKTQFSGVEWNCISRFWKFLIFFFFFFFFIFVIKWDWGFSAATIWDLNLKKLILIFFCQFHFFLFQQIMYGHVALNSDFRRYQIYWRVLENLWQLLKSLQ